MLLLIVIFIIGYLAIALEHKTHIDKSVPAILTGMLMWTAVAIFNIPLIESQTVEHALSHHLSEISSILFFLIGAMLIINALDKRGSISLIKKVLVTEDRTKLLWITTGITFFLSSVLDNLTTTIVMIALLSKMIKKRGDLLVFAVMVVIAANAGGAWSPIGDVTTTMLWVAHKITTMNLIESVFFPSVVQALVIPVIFTLFPSLFNRLTHGVVEKVEDGVKDTNIDYHGKRRMLFIGVLGLLSVPVFKYVTHLPPWVGMMIVASVVLILNEILNRKALSRDYHITHNHLLEKIEWNAILFFLGILSAVAVFQTVRVGELSMLGYAAEYLMSVFSLGVLGSLIGVFSAVIDNVPLVAASIGMFSFPVDHWFWHFIAYTAGTGGSILIIGSAAGVVAMSMLKIDFMWYTKRFSLLILLSYMCGVGVFFLNQLFI
jgi:Na+/H+ antiporter NhaD/arsenite permease-like protein